MGVAPLGGPSRVHCVRPFVVATAARPLGPAFDRPLQGSALIYVSGCVRLMSRVAKLTVALTFHEAATIWRLWRVAGWTLCISALAAGYLSGCDMIG